MANEIRLQKTVYEKGNVDKVIDRTFNTFAQPVPVEDLPTVEEFFELYEQLYYEIPIEGVTQSHQYLVQRSSELLNFEKDTDDIQPLLDEIAILREQILEYQQQLIEANTPQ